MISIIAFALLSTIIIDSSNVSSSFTLSVTNESVEIIFDTVSLNLAGCAVDKVTNISSEDICLFPQATPTAVCGSRVILCSV